MERDNRGDSSAENLDDFIDYLRMPRVDKHLRNTSRNISRRYLKFKSGANDNVILFKGDFVFGSRDSFPYSSDSLKIINDDSSTKTPLDYFKVIGKLNKIVNRNLVSNDFDIGKVPRKKPETLTAGLKIYEQQNPKARRVPTTYLRMQLLPFPGEEEHILLTRYFNPDTRLPIAEVWRAIRSRQK